MMPSWENAISAVAGALSATTALIAVYIAVRAEKRSRAVAAAQVYLDLRSRFLDIYTNLGDLDGEPADEEEAAARAAYWHHSFDEWYLSTRLAPNEFGVLWKDFYKRAAQAGLRHPALRQSFEKLQRDPAGFSAYAREFVLN